VGANNTAFGTNDAKNLCGQGLKESGEHRQISVCEHADKQEVYDEQERGMSSSDRT
jgi:hypothetical protein